MFSMFKRSPDVQGVLKELTEDQLSEVAGGHHQHHAHHRHTHHHHMWKGTPPPTMTPPPTTTPPSTTGTTTVNGVTYPNNAHW